MMYEFPDLRATLARWFSTVLPTIREFHALRGAGQLTDATEAGKWSYEVMQRPFETPDWVQVMMASKTYLSVRTQIERGVRTALSGDSIQEREIGLSFISAADGRFRAGRALPNHLDEAWLDSVYLPIEEYFRAECLPYVATIPLQGLKCESTPLELDEHNSFVRLPDSVLAEQRQRGVHYVEPDVSGTVPEELRYCLRHVFAAKKLDEAEVMAVAAVLENIEALRLAALRSLTATVTNRTLSHGLFLDRLGWASSKA